MLPFIICLCKICSILHVTCVKSITCFEKSVSTTVMTRTNLQAHCTDLVAIEETNVLLTPLMETKQNSNSSGSVCEAAAAAAAAPWYNQTKVIHFRYTGQTQTRVSLSTGLFRDWLSLQYISVKRIALGIHTNFMCICCCCCCLQLGINFTLHVRGALVFVWEQTVASVINKAGRNAN